MKHYNLTILLIMFMSMVCSKLHAYDISVKNDEGDTIYYNWINNQKELEVTYKSYYNGVFNGDFKNTSISIPETIVYNGNEYKVTSIGKYAFCDCSSLKSVTIPKGVTSIGYAAFYGCTSLPIENNIRYADTYLIEAVDKKLSKYPIKEGTRFIGYNAFYGCSSLTSVNIPEGVTDIGEYAFYDCSSLISINIPNSVTSIERYTFSGCSSLTSVTIPKGVTSIRGNTFSRCSNLKTITIPESVTSIGGSAFSRCSSLTSINIPESVTTIEQRAFERCSSLTSVTIPNSVTNIGINAFSYCNNITSISLPEGLKMISEGTFMECTSLKSLVIPSSVEHIYEEAFGNCGLIEVKSMAEKPPFAYDNTFSNYNIPLYVPTASISAYKEASPWSKFMEVNALSGETPTTQKCATPTISYQNGKLTFNCETEYAVCQSIITDSDITSYVGNEVQLSVTYHISVYATRAGYENSDVATATLCWIDVEPKTEGITNDIAQIPAHAVLIQSENGEISVLGLDDGTNISVYDVNGMQAGNAVSHEGKASINTHLSSGSIAIVRIGDKSIKVIMK